MTEPGILREVGKVGKPHGIRGEFQLQLLSDFPEWVADRETLLVRVGGAVKSWTVLSARFSGTALLLKLDGLPDRTAVEAARGMPLYVTETEARQAVEDPDYFFHSDLVGLELFDLNLGRKVGKVTQIFENTGSDLLEVSHPGGGSYLVPFVNPIVGEVKLAEGLIEVRLPEGLMDLNRENELPKP